MPNLAPDDFESGEEMVEVEIDFAGQVMPPKNDKVALIDADTLAFTSCLAAEEETSEFNEETGEHEAVFVIDMADALEKAEEKLQKILDRTGCQTCEMHFTGGRENFRYVIYPEYKANRTKEGAQRTPSGLKELKALLMDRYESTIAEAWEADDIVVYKKLQNPDKYIMCAVDKDVINAVPGEHFNYYESNLYNIDMKFVTITEDHARYWPYLQTIMGDTSDNVPGCKGIGKARAAKFINDTMDHDELWRGVVRAWESKGYTEQDAQLTMQLVNMNCLVEKDGKLAIELWSPDGECDVIPQYSYEYSYKALIKRILNMGTWKEGRNGRTISLFGETLVVDTSEYFPILTSRKMYYKGVLGELAAMLRGPKHVKDFEEFGCNYWSDWAEADGSLSLDYGNLWFNFNGVDQHASLIEKLKHNPNDRRMLISGWDPSHLDSLSLPCCHMLYQWYVENGNLHMIWYQRSVDTMIGLPSDVIFAAAWNMAIANEVGLKPGNITFMLGDTHIYEEHIAGAEEYLSRPLHEAPEYFWVAPEGISAREFLPSSVALHEYISMDPIKFEIKA